MINYGIVVHGGAGTPGLYTDGCKKACESAFSILETGGSSLDAVIRAVQILEDDGRFNAGSGSALRLDGKTIEMDAAVMNSEGKVGIVIAIRRIKNPVIAAHAVLRTPHVILAGEGATVFAQKQGLRTFRKPSKSAMDRYEKLKQIVREKRLYKEVSQWQNYDIESLWNFKDKSCKDVYHDTVGAVAIDRRRVLAVATSTGGFSPMMQGRVGDSPMIGCGFYAGPSAAIACTGVGEEIIKKMLARSIYDAVSKGEDIKEACEKGITMFPAENKVGVVVISKEGFVVLSNTEMANYSLIEEA